MEMISYGMLGLDSKHASGIQSTVSPFEVHEARLITPVLLGLERKWRCWQPFDGTGGYSEYQKYVYNKVLDQH